MTSVSLLAAEKKNRFFHRRGNELSRRKRNEVMVSHH